MFIGFYTRSPDKQFWDTLNLEKLWGEILSWGTLSPPHHNTPSTLILTLVAFGMWSKDLTESASSSWFQSIQTVLQRREEDRKQDRTLTSKGLTPPFTHFPQVDSTFKPAILPLEVHAFKHMCLWGTFQTQILTPIKACEGILACKMVVVVLSYLVGRFCFVFGFWIARIKSEDTNILNIIISHAINMANY